MINMAYNNFGVYKISHQKASSIATKFLNNAKLPSKTDENMRDGYLIFTGAKLRWSKVGEYYYLMCYAYDHNIELNPLGIHAD